LVLSAAALLSFLARAFIDYRFVYDELGFSTTSLGLVTLFNLAFFAGWIWALVSASHGARRAMFVLLAYGAILVLFGLATLISLCPSPCRTGWPVGEVTIWSNLLVGIPATVVVARHLFGRDRRTA
jgi:hypothetical protein